MVQEKPKPTKRGSIFGNFVEKLKSPTTEKKEHDTGFAAVPVKEVEPEASKPLEEAIVAAPTVLAGPETTVTEPAATTEEAKTIATVSTPSKEKEHFSFGKLFGSKDRAKSPAATEKLPEPKMDAAPKIDETVAPAVVEPVQPVEAAAPVSTETAQEAQETPKPAKRASFFGNLTRSLSKAAGGKTQPKEKKDTVAPAPVVEEETTVATVLDDKKEETSAPVISDVPAEAVSVGEAPKSTHPTVATTA
jgi:hypothetical protein